MTHYIAILVAGESGKWRALIPDVPGCQAEGYGVFRTKKAAAISLAQYARSAANALPAPRSLSEIERDEQWLIRNGVDFQRAIVTLVRWPGDPFPEVIGRA